MKKIIYSTLTFILIALLATIGNSFIGENNNKNAHAYLWTSSNNAANPDCTDNHDTWNNSTTFKTNSPWSFTFRASAYPGASSRSDSRRIEQLMDLNGDGLPDYMFSSKEVVQVTGVPKHHETYECIYLNNGSGWDETYRCVTKDSGGGVIKFYGDCAG